MREILFRGKTVDSGEWVIGSLHVRSNGDYFILNDDEGDKVEPSSIGEYTGLTDKNGKKIFEGDILEGIRYGNEKRAEVLWIDKAASWGIRYSFREKNESGYTSWLNSAWFRTINDARGPVVIGNIHDNSELLEVE